MIPKAIFLLAHEHWNNVYGTEECRRLQRLTSQSIPFYDPSSILENPRALESAEIILSGWGMPMCDATFLAAAPNLKAVFYAAGSVRCFTTEALWRRNIIVSSSNKALAAAVAEFTLGQILLSLKSMWRQMEETRVRRRYRQVSCPGIYGSVVGLISMGSIARHLVALLRPFHVRIMVYDPLLSREEARNLGVQSASLDDLFKMADVVSLHAPWLPETEGMIRGRHFKQMRRGATFINTARGAIVNEPEMIEALRNRPDIFALLDVTHPEPPILNSPLYDLRNIILTPHIAGAIGKECRRMGVLAIDEFERYLKKEALIGQVSEAMMSVIA
ncbi:MAG: hypothetical protein BGO12_05065 [Verrucomicrobia bacterium 61-8]|nr:MAG: hypothetical protein BGO12_05065 [Verrucomicrobia bacterium 61-8]